MITAIIDGYGRDKPLKYSGNILKWDVFKIKIHNF